MTCSCQQKSAAQVPECACKHWFPRVPSTVLPRVEKVDGVHRVVGGTKRALLISVEYFGQPDYELGDCYRDTIAMRELITKKYGFANDACHIKVLAEHPELACSAKLPTFENILNGIQWLIKDTKRGDSLLLHFSGHGAQRKDRKGDEHDGMDELLLPMDHGSKKVVSDDRLWDILVKGVPNGAMLTAIFDNCHSGTAMDLPYSTFVTPTDEGEKAAAAKPPVLSFARSGGRCEGPRGLVVSLCSCKDPSVSAMKHEGGKFRSVMSAALEYELKQEEPSYRRILELTHAKVNSEAWFIDQTPVLSSNYVFDLDAVFVL